MELHLLGTPNWNNYGTHNEKVGYNWEKIIPSGEILDEFDKGIHDEILLLGISVMDVVKKT